MDQTPVQPHPTPESDLPLLTFDQIMAAPDLATVIVLVPEWGGKVEIRPLTNGERTACSEASRVGDGGNGTRYDNTLYNQALLQASLVVPTVTKEQAAALLANKCDQAIHRVTDTIAEINGWSESAKKAVIAAFRQQTGTASEV